MSEPTRRAGTYVPNVPAGFAIVMPSCLSFSWSILRIEPNRRPRHNGTARNERTICRRSPRAIVVTIAAMRNAGSNAGSNAGILATRRNGDVLIADEPTHVELSWPELPTADGESIAVTWS